MQRYCDGDVDAFHALYAATAPPLLRYLRSLTRDDATAEEISQQTFLKLHSARASYARGADPVPWLYAIAQRTCIDELRRRRRSRIRLLPGAGDVLPEIEATLCGVPTFAGTGEPYSEAERTAVLAALDELPEEQQAAVALTKIHGLKVCEAARKLGTTEGALRVRAHRAYARLRELLGRDEMFQERVDAARSRHSHEARHRAAEVRL
jgi:RNA polymerase sigma-70 factor (ECF subfamily)